MTRDLSVIVAAGSRLHFGMFSFGRPDVPQFGGVGVMVDTPGVRLRISPAGQLTASGPWSERVRQTAQRVMRAWEGVEELPCEISVEEAPRQHIGLGSGTQLALAVTVGLHRFFQRDVPGVAELAQLASRGRRSAIGLYGFLQGGLLWEGGKQEREVVSPLVARRELPSAWRWVLFCPRTTEGLSGPKEQAAFEALPPVPAELTRHMQQEAEQCLFPAAERGDFSEFSRSLFRFGQSAGQCFQSQQAGLYATLQTAELVDFLSQRGIEGVGQTSWGPTVFALTPDERQARSLAESVRAARPELDGFVAATLAQGAQVSGP